MAIVLFEDERAERLEGVALARPAFAVHCGGYRLIDLVEQLGEPISAIVRPHLRALVAADFPSFVESPTTSDKPTLWINARLVPSASCLVELRRLRGEGRPGVVSTESGIAAAILPGGNTQTASPDTTAAEWFSGLGLPALTAELPLVDYPHDVVRHHLRTLATNLDHRLLRGSYSELGDGVFAGGDVSLAPHVVTDTRRGPIVLEAGVMIGPGSFLRGPLYISRDARILEHASIKDSVSIGPACKIGGEVEGSVIEGYTNKQHFGFLGHSYLGSWINLGAGTTNSDLKNSYGEVRVDYRGERLSTGMQFFGAIVGDYVKTAIGTNLFTGKRIGVGSTLYGYVTTDVPSFVNYARTFGQIRLSPIEAVATVQARMFERRGVERREIDLQLLHDMFAFTAHERLEWGEEIGTGPLAL